MGYMNHETHLKIVEFINNFIYSDEYNATLFGFISAGTKRNFLQELIEYIDNNKFKSIQNIRDSLIPLACKSNHMLGISYKRLIELRKSTTIQ
jgi:hypothetical protein